MSELSKLERLISIRIIQEDAEAIYSLLTTEKDSIFNMEIIPYYALFVQSCQEYMGQKYLPELIGKDIKDIRNHIKSYAERFGKSRQRVLAVNDMQDESFKAQLKFEFLKELNIHYNLGSYWTENRYIIGNTQQLADYLSIEDIFASDTKDKFYQIGYQIGSFVSSVRVGLSKKSNPPPVERIKTATTIDYYCDINTGKHNNLFLGTLPNELSLFFVHLLCNMNFVKHILSQLFAEGNIWILRVEYIVSYYTLRALERLKNYCENNNDVVVDLKDIANILDQGKRLFEAKLRNCMMHYNLADAGVITIENVNKPFYGIIENCFNGMSCKEYLASLHNFSDILIRYLGNKFDFSDVKLKRL